MLFQLLALVFSRTSSISYYSTYGTEYVYNSGDYIYTVDATNKILYFFSETDLSGKFDVWIGNDKKFLSYSSSAGIHAIAITGHKDIRLVFHDISSTITLQYWQIPDTVCPGNSYYVGSKKNLYFKGKPGSNVKSSCVFSYSTSSSTEVTYGSTSSGKGDGYLYDDYHTDISAPLDSCVGKSECDLKNGRADFLMVVNTTKTLGTFVFGRTIPFENTKFSTCLKEPVTYFRYTAASPVKEPLSSADLDCSPGGIFGAIITFIVILFIIAIVGAIVSYIFCKDKFPQFESPLMEKLTGGDDTPSVSVSTPSVKASSGFSLKIPGISMSMSGPSVSTPSASVSMGMPGMSVRVTEPSISTPSASVSMGMPGMSVRVTEPSISTPSASVSMGMPGMSVRVTEPSANVSMGMPGMSMHVSGSNTVTSPTVSMGMPGMSMHVSGSNTVTSPTVSMGMPGMTMDITDNNMGMGMDMDVDNMMNMPGAKVEMKYSKKVNGVEVESGHYSNH